MRVAMFADCYHPVINGVTTSIELLGRALREEGHEVLLFAPGVPGYRDAEPHVRRFASVVFPLHPEERVSFPWPWAHLQEAIRFRPDVVHIHTPFNVGLMGWFVAARTGAPRLFTHHTLFEEYLHYVPVPPTLMRPVAIAIARWFWNTSAVVIAPSEEVKARQLEQGIRRPLHVIPTGIDIDSFESGDPAGPRAELGLGPEDRLLLYMGRVAREKSLDFLLEAFADATQRDPRLRLAVIGDGPERPALEAIAQGLGLTGKAHFLGYRPRGDLRHYLAAARAFVFASQTETQGLVSLEAQSAGVPVVAVRASGTNEAVAPDVGGLLVEPGDREGFCREMVRVGTDDTLRARLSQGARVFVEGFSTRTMAHRTLSAYGEALALRGRIRIPDRESGSVSGDSREGLPAREP